MVNLKYNTRDEMDDIEKIVSEKNIGVTKSTLKRMLPFIKNRYKDFIQIEKSNRIANSSFTPIEKRRLLRLYSSQTRTARKIIADVVGIQDEMHEFCCISCGIGEADQIDHFLPQEHFPEFSILHKNLTPICGTCNKIKLDHIPGDIRDFVHPMFDTLPKTPFLECKISYSSSIPTVEFDLIKKYKTTVLGSHFKNMDLKARLEEKSIQYFIKISALKSDFGQTYAQDEITRNKTQLNHYFSSTYWKVLLCNEMLTSGFIGKI